MKYDLRVRWEVRLIALAVIVAGLLLWLFRPASMPPEVQLRSAASVAGFLLLMAAAGVAAMATVQFWKVLFLPRAAFHATELESLFGKRTVDQVLGLAASTDGLSPSDHKPMGLNHLLDNPTEVVMGQLRSAADYIMLRPGVFVDALFRLAGDAGKPAVERYLAQHQQSNMSQADSVRNTDDALVEVRFFVEQRLNLEPVMNFDSR